MGQIETWQTVKNGELVHVFENDGHAYMRDGPERTERIEHIDLVDYVGDPKIIKEIIEQRRHILRLDELDEEWRKFRAKRDWIQEYGGLPKLKPENIDWINGGNKL